METAPKLAARGISKRYGAVTALEPTDLDVRDGEFLTLLGPSGSGKTTLLQLVCGLTEPSAGTLLVDGVDQIDVPAHRRDMGLVFQHYALFPHLTVAENIAFPLRMRGRDGRDIDARVADALAMVHMEDYGRRFPRELSGGQQQRVALARCFVYQPSIILMDEPLGALDKKLRDHMQIEIKQLHRESGATIIYVTHDQEEALALSDRICLMNHARIEQLGTPHEIYRRPRTEFAADFIGVSNILRGTVETDGAGRATLATPSGRFAMPAGAPPNGRAALVVRPEQLSLDPSLPNRVSAQVREVVFAGSELRVIATLAQGQEIILRLPPSQTPPARGATIEAGWAPDDAAVVP